MNPHTGDVTPMDPVRLLDDPVGERERAAREVGLDDPDDLVLLEGTAANVERIADAVKAQAKADRRAAGKRARQSRKRNRKG